MWKPDFPSLRDRDLVYCDNAATTHKPDSVINAISQFYRVDYAPIGRGMYASAERATQAYEDARADVADFIGARSSHEVVFTRGATEGINIIAWSWAWHEVAQEDEIVISDLEHHAHYVTWQRFAQLKGCTIRRIPVTQNGDLDYEQAASLITHRTKLVAISAHSNVIGVPIDTTRIVKMARACNAYVVCDASQKAPRAQLHVHDMGYDFCVFSFHKMLGPTGLGVLYVAREHHEKVQPYYYGGGMVYHVAQESHTWRDMPHRCEAGSPPSAQVVGAAAAVSYLRRQSLSQLKEHEALLSASLIDGVQNISGLHVVGPSERIAREGHIVTIYHETIDAHDIALYLDMWGICVRSGHHCAQPLHDVLNIRNTVRISWYGYNTISDVEHIVLALERLVS